MEAGGVAGSADDASEGCALRPVDAGCARRAVPVEAMFGSPGVGDGAVTLTDAAPKSLEGGARPVADDDEDAIGAEEVAGRLGWSTGAVAEGAMDDAVLRVIKVS